jgi:hypothetical protein
VTPPPATGEDVVLLAGSPVPRSLYRRYRRIIDLFWVAGLSPLLMLIVYAVIPVDLLIALAQPFVELFWSHFKSVSLEQCGAKCGLMSWSLVAVPVSWAWTIVLVACAIPFAAQNAAARQAAYEGGAAVYGNERNGARKPPPGPVLNILIGLGCGTVVAAVLIALLVLIYLLAGSDRTVSRGRELSLPSIAVLLTVLMGLSQVSAALLAGFLTSVGWNINRRRPLQPNGTKGGLNEQACR